MKKLFLLRHAKSSWDDPACADIDRPLKGRGKRDARTMGKRLQKRAVVPGRIITSPARRARKTARILAQAIGYPPKRIRQDRAIYEGNVWDLLRLVKKTARTVELLMVVGHNPGITGFANYLSSAGIANVPTCGIVGIELNVDCWKQVVRRRGRCVFYDYPNRRVL